MSRMIIGNSIACLVSAYELGNRGEKVTLVKHRGQWGAHFGGVDTCGVHYDAGMAIVELTSTNLEENPELASYDLKVRNDVGRFFGIMKPYVESHVPMRQIEPPQCYFRASWNKDFLLCNDFEVFSRLNPAERELVARQLADRDSSNWRHASQKVTKQYLHTIGSYRETSHYNHGSHLHGLLIEPFVNKLTGVGSDAISSLYHRRLWCPLYYPETLREAALGKIDSFGGTVIHYPTGTSFRGFADAFLSKLNEMDNVEVVTEAIVSVNRDAKTIKVEGREESIAYSTIAWGGGLFECQRLFGVEPVIDSQSKRVDLTFEFLVLDGEKVKKEFSIVFVLDGNVPCYRITNQTVCAGEDERGQRIIVEYNTGHLKSRGIFTKEEVHATTVSLMIGMGIIADSSAVEKWDVKAIPQLLPLCNHYYGECSQANIELLREQCPELSLMGDASGVSTRSIADNILQGLKYAEVGTV